MSPVVMDKVRFKMREIVPDVRFMNNHEEKSWTLVKR